MIKLILSISILFSLSLSGQVVFDKTEHDFENIESGSQRYVDFYLKNTGEKTAFILSVDKPMEIVYIQRSAMISPDSSTVLRFQINQRTKGRFNYKIPVYTSDKNEPTVIHLKGNITELPKNENNFTACPSFGQSPSDGNPMDFKLIVETIDKETREKLSNSTVALIQNGSPLGKWKTNSNGRFTAQVPLGITYFYATHTGYFPAELGAYINFKRNKVTLELERSQPEEENPAEIAEESIVETTEEDEIIVPEEVDIEELIVEEEEDEEEEIIQTPAEEPSETPTLSELDKDNFDPEFFKPVNVVFVIDVSSSMRQADRIELLKFSLTQLVEMLRPEDRIGLVSYSTDARVLLRPTSGKNKEEINEIIRDLKASGLTAGGEGIKLGYRQAKRNFLNEGENQVIIITDGAFNRNSGDYKKYIKKYLRKGINLSVVGIKSNEKSEESMREAAELGEGRFILIEKLADAQRELKQEIRIASFRY